MPTASPAFPPHALRYPSLCTQEKGRVLLTPASPRQSSLKEALAGESEVDEEIGLYDSFFKEVPELSQVIADFSSN